MKIEIHNPNNLPTIDYREVDEFQGNLKDLSFENYEKLKQSIVQFGFYVPIFIWESPEGKKLIDGHQRVRILKNEKVQPFRIPYVLIEAESVEEAKKKLLTVSSQYGKITQEGFDEFTFDIEEDWTKAYTSFDALFSPFQEEETLAIEQEEEEITSKSLNLMTFAGKKIKLSDKEAKAILEVYKNYVKKNTTDYGFITYLLNLD